VAQAALLLLQALAAPMKQLACWLSLQLAMQQPPVAMQLHSTAWSSMAPQHHMGLLTCWLSLQLVMAMQQLLATGQLHSMGPSTQLTPQHYMGWLTARLLLQMATLQPGSLCSTCPQQLNCRHQIRKQQKQQQ
jgi:hypothetical protein